jgi:hypothetical protein
VPHPFGPDRGFLPPSRRRSWTSLGFSFGIHAAIIALAVLLTRPRPEEPADESRAEHPADAARQQVIPFYLPPPPPPPPPPRAIETPPPRAVVPPPKKQQLTPEPEPNAPPEATRSTGTASPEPAKPGADRAPEPAPERTGPPAEISTAPTLESEARRIFGRKRAGPPPGAGPRDVRPMESYLPDRPDRCIPRPSLPAESAGAPQYGVVVGRIYRGDTGQPLPGAHLQMLGTPFTAFTDETGEYHFRFELALVDNCRTQYVRVSAPGYQSRLLVLLVGANVRSEDVALRRR